MTNLTYYFSGGIVLVSVITGMILSPKGADGATKFRRIFLSLMALLCLSAVVTGIWYWVDKTERKRRTQDDTVQVTPSTDTTNVQPTANRSGKISAQQISGRWRTAYAFWDLGGNGKTWFKFFNGQVKEGTWEIEDNILMVRFPYSTDYGCYVYDFHDTTFSYRDTDDTDTTLYKAQRLN